MKDELEFAQQMVVLSVKTGLFQPLLGAVLD